MRRHYPDVRPLVKREPCIWINNRTVKNGWLLNHFDVEDARARLEAFAPFLERAFPQEVKASKGIIESPLVEIPKMKEELNKVFGTDLRGRLMIKLDSHLPISGSVKARGGIYEVLKYAEDIAIKEGLIKEGEILQDYGRFFSDEFKKVFSKYKVAVGSTGNLGLSIGIISAALGFDATVHMSSDARAWKKDKLRSLGVKVVEYEDDYGKACEEGRKQASEDPKCHFVDDEASLDLFLGYAVAGKRLRIQLETSGISVDKNHPLFVYIPCGVGGAPGGIAYGIKQEYGEHAHIFFVEPVDAPAMTLGLMTQLHNKISVQDIGLSGLTHADGLAVSRPSALVGEIMNNMLNGALTVKDEDLYIYLAKLYEQEKLLIEPSACAAIGSPWNIEDCDEYLLRESLMKKLDKATHIVWATGGNMVPKNEMRQYLETGKKLMSGKTLNELE